MRVTVILLAVASLSACDRSSSDSNHPTAPVVSAQLGFDGGDYSTAAAKVAHGERLSQIFTCSGCHGADYSGVNFGAMLPIVEGLWAPNISLSMKAMSDAELERVLRKGVTPSRDEIYVMPSKQTQFLTKSDMDALIAYLRTIPAKGKPTPLPPADFEDRMVSRLPDDYWRWVPGEKRDYHNAAEEVAYFATHQPPKLGESTEQGRYIAITVCSGCHGAALDGKGEDAGGIKAASLYTDAEFDRLLTTSTSRDGRSLKMTWGFGHEVFPLTKSEKSAVTAYARKYASTRRAAAVAHLN